MAIKLKSDYLNKNIKQILFNIQLTSHNNIKKQLSKKIIK